jgi:N-acetylmuramoyl-L-alanine amidase
MKIIESSTPNFDERRDGKTPRLLILHYTDTLSLEETLGLLRGTRKASAHYIVDEDGSVIRLVDEKHRAWHAGIASWEAETDVNSVSIGIELQNPGHHHGYRAFQAAQLWSAMELCKDIVARYKIKPWHVLGHSDITPMRNDRPDPGHLFPWKDFAAQGVGIWPVVTAADRDAAQLLAADEKKMRDLLTRYGYDAGADFALVKTAFQRHFEPECFSAHDRHGPFGGTALARLSALARMKADGEKA